MELGRSVAAGKPKRQLFYIPEYTPAVEAACRSFLNLHDTVFAAITLGCPSTVQDWQSRLALFSAAFRRHKTTHLTGGPKRYTVLWVVRTFLHAQLTHLGHSLAVTASTLVAELPGPDEERYLRSVERAFDCTSARALFALIGYTGAAHLFCMALCFVGRQIKMRHRPSLKLSRKRKRSTSMQSNCPKRLYVLYKGSYYQTPRDFLEDKGINSPLCEGYKLIHNA